MSASTTPIAPRAYIDGDRLGGGDRGEFRYRRPRYALRTKPVLALGEQSLAARAAAPRLPVAADGHWRQAVEVVLGGHLTPARRPSCCRRGRGGPRSANGRRLRRCSG